MNIIYKCENRDSNLESIGSRIWTRKRVDKERKGACMRSRESRIICAFREISVKSDASIYVEIIILNSSRAR